MTQPIVLFKSHSSTCHLIGAKCKRMIEHDTHRRHTCTLTAESPSSPRRYWYDAYPILNRTTGSAVPWPMKIGNSFAGSDIIYHPCHLKSLYTARNTLELTSFSFFLDGKYELRPMIPASFRSLESPVNRLCAPPWLKPPNTIRDAPISGVVSISDLIISFMALAEDSNPTSSSAASMSVSDAMSYLRAVR